jgi:3-deoxy-D-manno-octulosonic-acid transferase/heptosyltransferase-1
VKNKKPNILIIKLSAVGDVVHSLPFLEVLRDRFPSAMIDWVVEEDASGIVESHPEIDRLIIFPRKSWLKRFIKKGEYIGVGKEVTKFLKELKSRRYDIVVDLQGLLKSGILTFLANGKRKIALNGGREGSLIFTNEKVAIPDPDLHALDKYLCIARYLGATNPVWNGQIPIYDTDEEHVDYLLGEIGNNSTLVAVNPMAKWESKLWELHRFASLADTIKEELGAGVVFTGSEGDKAAIEDIRSGMKTRALNLAAKTTLKELAYLYQKCAAVICTDTGPMHVAAAMGSPVVVALFGPTSPLRTGPYGAKHRVIRAGLECSPCFKKRCDDMSCMKKITVEMVFGAVREVLSA